MLSLLHDVIEPHLGHVAVFPLNVEVSKDFLSPKAMGEGNSAEHCVHTTIVCAI